MYTFRLRSFLLSYANHVIILSLYIPQARYFVDEVKDKSGKEIDVSSWAQEFVEDLPEQENGFVTQTPFKLIFLLHLSFIFFLF